jgi:tetratricopeptide (TPR) repeat protein
MAKKLNNTAKRTEQIKKRAAAFAAFHAGDFTKSSSLGFEILGDSWKDTDLVGLVGIANSKLGNTIIADRYLRKALKTDPSRNAWRYALAESLMQENRLDEALVEYERVIADGEQSQLPVIGKAAVLERRGDYEGVRALVSPHITTDETGFAASMFAIVLNKEKDWLGTIDLLKPWIARPNTDPRVLMSMSRTISQAYEQTDQIPLAFDSISESNRLCAKPYDRDAYENMIDDLIATYSPQNMEMLAKASEPNERPVFVASMPRSGSTLVEQIIHAHPQGFGAGEVSELVHLTQSLPKRLKSIQPYPDCLGDWNPQDATSSQSWYLEKMKQHEGSSKRIVNKNLDNWLHLGLVDLALPGSKIIHVSRDPMDNGFSIFMAALHTGVYPWSTDLANIGHVLKMHSKLMDHWKSVLNNEILEVQYEELVASPEEWIRKIIGFIGLEWDNACLEFHTVSRDVNTLSYDQVRRPIYSSAVSRWKKYDQYLGPLRETVQTEHEPSDTDPPE